MNPTADLRKPDLSRATCAYCTKRAHAIEWEGDQQVPVCKDHAR